ncbi:CDP-alcohol phosphatidyltransferase family protein [Fertoebacter nigrum]|uniref:CDP-alcohol phosphatidyltransferase family protein n=2 Tax=Fertoeibacter niger TaxID=2656921 RepID=A0A8X8H4H1_9RHOB|nr:CDP-alcohol phosphatidyltransferase family protein [Fertoeibacter niger]
MGAGAAGWLLSPGTIAPLLAFACVVPFVARQMRLHYPHDRLGGCNAVTMARAAVVCALLAPLVGDGPQALGGWAVPLLAVTSLALDGVDGWLARNSGLASGFGARFDMEVDAALAAVLCLLALDLGKAGPWLLALGFLRYAWVLAGFVWPWLNGALPERFSRKAVCVVQIAILIALLAPVVQPPVSQGLAALALVPLLWSFAVDLRWRARHRV